MLIVNNGYGKSGTTWIQRGLRYYFAFRPFDKAYQNPRLANASIEPQQILTFTSRVDIQAVDYYSKSHWKANEPIEGGRLAQALLKVPGVVVINSIRNVGDSVVSWYHHRKREGETREFEPWFWDVGAGFVHQYMNHHMSWAHTDSPPFLFSYEELKRGPYEAFARFREHVGLEDDRSADAFNEYMDFNVSKTETQSVHMRKGIVGDRVNYLTAPIVAHIEEAFLKRRFYDKCAAYFDAQGIDRADLVLNGQADAAPHGPPDPA